MNELFLLDALVKRLNELFSDYELLTKNGLYEKVRVFAQYMPQPQAVTVKSESTDAQTQPQGYTAADFESNFPCVVVKLDEAVDREEGALDAFRVNVRFLVGVYAYEETPAYGEDYKTDSQGYRDVLNIIEIIRQEFITNRVLDKKYRLEMPLRSYLFDEQAWPIYFGQIESVWETGRPLMQVKFDGRLKNERL